MEDLFEINVKLNTLLNLLQEQRRRPIRRIGPGDEEEPKELGTVEEQNRTFANQILYAILSKTRWKELEGVDEGTVLGKGYYIDVPVKGRGLGPEGEVGVGRLVVQVSGTKEKRVDVWVMRPVLDQVVRGEKFRSFDDLDRISERIATRISREIV